MVIGQVLSLCITGTGVTAQLLSANYDVNVPTSQSFLNYALLAVVFLPALAISHGDARLFDAVRARWWKYALLAAVDVEANFLVVLAYQYTTISSVQLIDGSAVIWVAIMSYFLLRVRFHWMHYLGILVCLGGFIGLVIADPTSQIPAIFRL